MDHVSTSIATVRSILIHIAADQQAVLMPDPYGYTLLVQPQPVLLRAIYIAPTENLESAIDQARGRLDKRNEPLIAVLPGHGNEPEVTSRIFVFEAEQKLSLSGSLHDQLVAKYTSPRQHAGYVWFSDWQQGKAGYFLTGHSSTSNLWRITRLDIDAFDSAIIVLRPIRLFADIPSLQLTNISDALVRGEIDAHYTELQRAIASHNYRAMITHARSIVESAIELWLVANGQTPGNNLFEHLAVVQKLRMESKRELPWFSDLAYHAAYKIRLLHARTHVDRIIKQRRPVEPQLALSCIEDLKEILRETRLADH